MNIKKSIIFFIIIIIITPTIYGAQKIPYFIKSQSIIFYKLAKVMAYNFPKNIEILIYELNLLNGTEEIKQKINLDFYKILNSQQTIYKYSIKFEKEIIEQEIDLLFIKKQDELELIALGKYLKLDAVMLSSVTIIAGKTKKVWDKISKNWENKKVALFQGNFFNTENNSSMLRFSYYFLLD
ncbi:MAG: hypothetical protein KAT05_00510 [Spirochaetes bacterium]|nr:hypothetical protein [Spirochaetota bacterium]